MPLRLNADGMPGEVSADICDTNHQSNRHLLPLSSLVHKAVPVFLIVEIVKLFYRSHNLHGPFCAATSKREAPFPLEKSNIGEAALLQ